MCKIALISMPVCMLQYPAISLAQLKTVTRRAHGDRVEIDIFQLNHDFASFMGVNSNNGGGPAVSLWGELFEDVQMTNTGLGDWFFRQVAFPESDDNTDYFLSRYYHGRKDAEALRLLRETRPKLESFLEGLIDRYALDSADIVGFGSMFQQTVAALAMSRLLKRRRPEIITVMGGANLLPPMGNQIAANAEHLDYVFAGPALKSFPEFVGRFLDGERSDFTSIQGVINRENAASSKLIGQEQDINVPMALDYDFFFESFERHLPETDLEPFVFFETSRGCWWGAISHCTFCGLNGDDMGYRAMEPALAVEQFKNLFRDYGDKSKHFFCVDNIMPKEFVHGVFPHIKAPAGSDIFYEIKSDISEEGLRVIAEAGVTKLQPGLESLATSTLKLMGKGTSCFVNLAFLKNCLKFNIIPQWNLLVGFPGEEKAVFEKYISDLPRLVHLFPPTGAHPVRFDRYSPYFMKAEEYGLRLKPYEYYGLTFPFDERSLGDFAYFFEDLNYDAPYIQVMAPYLQPLNKVIDDWHDTWHQETVPMPELFVDRSSGRAVLSDSRGSELIEHQLTPIQEQLLDFLEKPRRQKDCEELCRQHGADPAAEFAFLEKNLLLWEENGRYMSVVLPVRSGMASTDTRRMPTL